jgi:DNA-binding transcriptional LysR family regulator
MSPLPFLDVFVCVVEQQGFAAAARQLGVTTSAVSKQIQMLEAHLGVSLLHRTTRRLSLTQEGALFFERAKRLLEDMAEAEALVREARRCPKGTLRVNAPVSFGMHCLAQPFARFAERYPEVTLEVEFDDRMVDVVQEGYDVVIRIATLPDSSLIARKLGDVEILYCASPVYLARQGTPMRPEAMRQHMHIEYSRHPDSLWRYLAPDGRTGSVNLPGHFKANNAEMMRAAALQGLGLTRLPDFMVHDDLAAGRLVRVLPEYRTHPPRHIYALFSQKRHLSARTRAFIDFMSETFAKGLPPRLR